MKYLIEITKEQFNDCKKELQNIITQGNNIIDFCMLPFENNDIDIEQSDLDEIKKTIEKIKLIQKELLSLNCPSKFCDKPKGCEQNLGVATLKSEHLAGVDDTAASAKPD